MLWELGFTKANVDDCLYVLRKKDTIIIMALVYVDDMAVTGPELARIEAFKKTVAERFPITDKGELDFIVSI